MKRTVIAAVGTALLASLSLSACSTNSGNNIELTVWTSQEDQKNQDAWLQTMQAWFEEDHPELNITWHNSGFRCRYGGARPRCRRRRLPIRQ